jgi:acetyl esterase/lipase
MFFQPGVHVKMPILVRRETLARFYKKYNPAKVQELDEILTTFEGRHELLRDGLKQRYGEEIAHKKLRRGGGGKIICAVFFLLVTVLIQFGAFVEVTLEEISTGAASTATPTSLPTAAPTIPKITVAYKTIGGRDLELDVHHIPYGIRPIRNYPRPTIVHIHGGAWLFGAKGDLPTYIIDVATQSWSKSRVAYTVVDIDYRLAGDIGKWGDASVAFPAQLHDCVDAIAFLIKNAHIYQVEPERIAVWGESAGAHLASLVATYGSYNLTPGTAQTGDPRSSVRQVKVKLAVAFYPPTDLLRMDPDCKKSPSMGPSGGCGITHDNADSPESKLITGGVIGIGALREYWARLQEKAGAKRGGKAASGVAKEAQAWKQDGCDVEFYSGMYPDLLQKHQPRYPFVTNQSYDPREVLALQTHYNKVGKEEGRICSSADCPECSLSSLPKDPRTPIARDPPTLSPASPSSTASWLWPHTIMQVLSSWIGYGHGHGHGYGRRRLLQRRLVALKPLKDPDRHQSRRYLSRRYLWESSTRVFKRVGARRLMGDRIRALATNITAYSTTYSTANITADGEGGTTGAANSTALPTTAPTAPTAAPTTTPTSAPTTTPTAAPTAPTAVPTATPTAAPTAAPTFSDDQLEPFLRLAVQADPVTFVGAGTPPHFVGHGTTDSTVPYWQGVRLQRALQKAGVEHQFMPAVYGAHNTWSNTTAWKPVEATAVAWVLQRL